MTKMQIKLIPLTPIDDLQMPEITPDSGPLTWAALEMYVKSW